MRFEFATAGRIIFGEGTASQVAAAAKSFGNRALLVTGSDPARAETVTQSSTMPPFTVRAEPTVDLIAQGVRQARESACDVVIAIGGGSVIDAGKAIAGLLTHRGEVMDYLEVVGRGKPLENPAAPFIAVPTTAGTGSEVTRNAVLGVPERRVKVSLRSPLLLPRLAMIDPELTLDLPPAVTARTGLDALTQLIEAYVSIRANPLTDGFCEQGIPLAARSLRRAFHHGQDLEARRDMSLAAMLSGLALANAGLGVIHGFAAPLGGRYPAPHGAICAAILPQGIETNLLGLWSRAPGSPALARYQKIAAMLTGRADAVAQDVVTWTRTIVNELGIPPLRSYGVEEKAVPEICADAAKASSMKGNPLELTHDELVEIMMQSL